MKAARIIVTFVLTVALGATALGTSVALLVPASHALLAATSPLPKVDVSLKAEPQRSYVFDSHGALMTTLFDVDRAPVSLANVPKQLIDAVLAIEDRKFYEHNGVDWAGTFRALFRNVDAGTVEQGASTITEQLVKNTLTKGLKRDLKTKIREADLAIRLEHALSKNQILEDYLNLVSFGNNAFGIEVAAERYFDETMVHLTLPQSALLAGLVQAPSALDPITHPAQAARRRSEVLQAMVETHTITVRQETAANSAPLPTKVFYPKASQRSYYIDALLEQLSNPNPYDPADPANVLGKTPAQVKQALYEGGLRIYTNYDPVMEFEANAAISNIIPQNQSQFTAALVAIDNTNGAVRAVAFGRGYDASQFDPAVDGPGRQAGSSFKGITLATALSSGYSPDDRVSGSPLSWRIGPGNGSGSFYSLSGDCHGGDPTLTEAIAISDNCAYVRTEISLGPGNYGHDGVTHVIAMANKMGINTSNFQPVVSTTLGTNGVHPLEMAQAYSVIAADGVLHPAEFVSKIVGPTGKVLYQNKSQGVRVLTPQVAAQRDPNADRRVDRRNRSRAEHRTAGRRQDRDHRRQPGRLVHRLHAADHHRGLDGRPRRGNPDDRRRWHLRVRRDIPCPRLGRVHAGRAHERTGRQLHPTRREPVAESRADRRTGPRQRVVLLPAGADLHDLTDRAGDRPDHVAACTTDDLAVRPAAAGDGAAHDTADPTAGDDSHQADDRALT